MEKITCSTVIHAPREKVWNTMLGKDTYQEWTAVFHEGSTFECTWEEGSEMKFIGPSEDGSVSGMYAVIAANRPHEFVSIRHLGELEHGEKKPWSAAPGQEGYENYTFSDVEGGTEVLVELTVPPEWKDMFTEMWPKALAKLKDIAEK